MHDQSIHPDHVLLAEWIIVVALIVGFNLSLDLKDREVYRLFFDSLSACDGLACLLLSDDLRSPVFLGLIIGAHRAGIGIDAMFIAIATASTGLMAWALPARADRTGHDRFALVSLALGTWLYLIQVKLGLAVGLFLAAQRVRGVAPRVLLLLGAVLTHESVLLLVALQYVWSHRERKAPVLLPLAAVLAALGVLAATVPEIAGVFGTVVDRVQHYRDLAAAGEVGTLSRTSFISGLLLVFALAGWGLNLFGRIEFRAAVWMSVPWLMLMLLASNEVLALRLSSLALLHVLVVTPIVEDRWHPCRAVLFVTCAALGAFTLYKDVILA